MPVKDYRRLIQKLEKDYRIHAPASADFQRKAEKVLVDGGSHTLRLIEPFPPRIVQANGAYIRDLDGHPILDFWQGHYANILGHNPPEITGRLAELFLSGNGLQTGFVEKSQAELAALLCRQTGMDRFRFTTSGTLSTMYAILLARAFTGRERMMKVGGGWHGAHLWGLKGVKRQGQDFRQVDSAGIPHEVADEVVITRFNDPAQLEADFHLHGSHLACFIVEPVIGAGGMMPATQEFLSTARRLCDQFGVVLIFDEVISGFRYRAGDVGSLFGIHPDLITMGKIIGGGMPVAAVGGQAEMMELIGRRGGHKVKFSGGTYSGHPASMVAAKSLVQYLVEHEAEIYPKLGALGIELREKVLKIFSEAGINACFAGGESQLLKHNSLHMLVFPHQACDPLTMPDQVLAPEIVDVEFGERVLKLAMLLEDVHIVHGLGALSTAHTEEDIEILCEAYRKALNRIETAQE